MPRVIHHNNCTWCKHRFVWKDGPKRRQREHERCSLTGDNLPEPFKPETIRYCDNYQQVNCQCEACNLTINSAI